MKVSILTLSDLFEKTVRYMIPTFQRPYVWTQDDQWEPLWDDVRGTAERYFEGQGVSGNDAAAFAHTPAHFLGAIVLQQQPFGTGEIEPRLVVDGQQRLTTLQLLLDATQEVFEDLDLTPAKQLSMLVRNNEVMLNGKQDHAFKVWPTRMDQDAFRHAMLKELPSDEYTGSKIVEAHEFFKLQVREWLADSPWSKDPGALALQAAITRLLNLVVIDLDMEDDPHIIFETLNARGTALLQADLVKNFIDHEAGEKANDLSHSYLAITGTWWRENVRQGRLFRPHVDVFLNYWITMRKMEEIQPSNVFSTVRGYAEDGRLIAEVAADIGRMADIYHNLQITEDDSALGRFLDRWRVMQMGVLTPVLMRLISLEMTEEKLERCLQIIESYLVRRMVCRMTTKDYNTLFLSLLRQLEEDAISTKSTDDLVRDFFADQTAESRLWPDDDRLTDAFLSSPLYRLLTRGRLRLILEGIEGQMRVPFAEDAQVPKNLTIEHVMPQGWRDHWVPPPATDTPGEAETRRDRLIHTIGNLSLMKGSMQPVLSNRPWLEKREEMRKQITLHLNKDLLNAGDVWNEETIAARGRRLATVAAEVWPHADRV